LAFFVRACGSAINAEVLFRLSARQQIAEDDEGEDFPGLDQAHAAALASAREFVADNIKFAASSPWDAVIITSESGDVLMTVAAKDVLPKSLK
jgi:hypothetical protein